MAFDRETANRFVRANSVAVQVIAVSMLVVVASVWVGKQARARTIPLDARLQELDNVSSRLADWRKNFQLPDTNERAAFQADSALAETAVVPGGSRLTLAQNLAATAERAGLRDVQINFGAPPESTFVAPRTSVGDKQVSVAPYVVTVECAGSYAAALAFVNQVPASLSITRLGAIRGKTETRYRIVLSVYEVASGAN